MRIAITFAASVCTTFAIRFRFLLFVSRQTLTMHRPFRLKLAAKGLKNRDHQNSLSLIGSHYLDQLQRVVGSRLQRPNELTSHFTFRILISVRAQASTKVIRSLLPAGKTSSLCAFLRPIGIDDSCGCLCHSDGLQDFDDPKTLA